MDWPSWAQEDSVRERQRGTGGGGGGAVRPGCFMNKGLPHNLEGSTAGPHLVRMSLCRLVFRTPVTHPVQAEQFPGNLDAANL